MKSPTRKPKEKKRPVVTVDFDKYLSYAEKWDMSDEQKRELIATLYSIMFGFVDLGFGVDVVNQACGKTENKPGKPTLTASNGVKCQHKLLTERFEIAVESDEGLKAGKVDS